MNRNRSMHIWHRQQGQTRTASNRNIFQTCRQGYISSKVCLYVKWFFWRQEESKMCSSYGIQLVCVEVWGWRTLFWKRCWLYGQKIPSVCQCIQSESKKASKSTFSQMWLPTLWEMWGTLYQHYEDHWWSWWNNDYSPTPKDVFGLPDSQLSDQLVKAVSMQILHEDLGMPITLACLEKSLHPKIIM